MKPGPGAPKPLAKAALLAALVLIAGALQLTRAGYSVDEEFTVFAVRGIEAGGLPLLPSGLLYDRGIAYSYASWLAGAVTGSALPAFRALSLISAALVVLMTFRLVKRHANDRAALLAAILVAASVPFWATATSARFYAPFLATLIVALASLGSPVLFGLAALLGRLTHELAFLLAVVPFVCLLFARGDRRRWSIACGAAVLGLILGQAILFALHALEPSSGETMVRRFFLWQVLNLFERPADRQFGIPIVVIAIAWLVAPKRAWPWSIVALSVAAMILAFSIARATDGAPLSMALVTAILREGSRYPLDMWWHIARATPITLLVAIGALTARAAGLGGEWRPVERAAHLLWIGWVLWFGVIESGITTNYLLLPVSFMLIAIGIDVDAILRHNHERPLPGLAVMLLIVVAVTADEWRGEGPVAARLEMARPTIDVPGLNEIRDALQPGDRVVCTDELGCLMLVGRIDRWLALDDYVRERFVVRREGDHVTGVYTGVPAAFRPGEIFAPNPDGSLPDRTLIVDIFKEYPIGNSRAWLPRAIEEDGLTVTPLLETPQIRVLQVSPPQRYVAFQPWR